MNMLNQINVLTVSKWYGIVFVYICIIECRSIIIHQYLLKHCVMKVEQRNYGNT